MSINLTVCIMSIIVYFVGAVMVQDSSHDATPPDTASGMQLIGFVTILVGLVILCIGLGIN